MLDGVKRPTVMLCSERLVLLVQITCQDQQDSEAAFGSTEGLITHNATGSKINSQIHHTGEFILFYHRFCNSPRCIITLPATNKHKITY